MSGIKFARTAPAANATQNHHPDYEQNLEEAEKFRMSLGEYKPHGMNASFGKGDHWANVVVFVSYRRPYEEWGNNFSIPVALDQSNRDFSAQLHKARLALSNMIDIDRERQFARDLKNGSIFE